MTRRIAVILCAVLCLTGVMRQSSLAGNGEGTDFRQLGKKVTIPRGTGYKVRIPRWKSPFSQTVAGNVGVTVPGPLSAIYDSITETADFTLAACGVGMCAESLTGQVIQMGGVRGYNDKIVIVARANFLEGALESLGREMAFRIDRYFRRQLSAGGNLSQVIAGGTTTAASTSRLWGKNIAKVPAIFDSFNVPRFDSQYFTLITHPQAQIDLFTDQSANGFVTIARYNDAIKLYRGEVGMLYGTRILMTNTLPKVVGLATNTATYGVSVGLTGVNAYAVAPEAFYSIELEGGGLEVIHMPLGSGGINDPLARRGSIGAKVWVGVAPVDNSVDKRCFRFVHTLGLRL